MIFVQELDDLFIVSFLTEREFEKVHLESSFAVTTSQGGPGVFAIRCVDGSLLVGTQSDLSPILKQLIDSGAFDSVPLLRFRLSAFCRADRVAEDAKCAWTWLKQSASQWSADNWKLESTIRPEVIRRVGMHLRAAGEGIEIIETINHAIDVRIEGRQAVPVIRIPASEPWTARCKSLLKAETNLLGDATAWWPELESCSPLVLEIEGNAAEPFDVVAMQEILAGAKTFLDEELFFPAQNDPAVPKTLRNRFANTRTLVSQFEKIGDLVRYIERFSQKNVRQMQLSLPSSYASLESVHDEFIELYGQYREYCSDIFDLVRGKDYSGPFLSILSRSYTNRSGGILPVGKIGQHKAVLVKATLDGKKLDGRKYQDRWIEQGVCLKYYLKTHNSPRNKKNDEQLPENRSIIDYPELPILVFVKKQDRPSLYSYHGFFMNLGVVDGKNGDKWFDLVRRQWPLRQRPQQPS